MNPNNKHNSNFIYSLAFFILANLTLFLDPLERARTLILSVPILKSKILFSSFFSTFEQITGSVIFLVFIFLLCSVYFSIQFMRKEPNDKKLFRLIPKNLPGFFVVLLVIASLIYVKMIVVGFMTYL